MKQIDPDLEPVLTHEAVQAIKAIPALLLASILLAGPVAMAAFGAMELLHWLKHGVAANYHLAMYSPPLEAGGYEGVRQIIEWVWLGWIGIPIAIATVAVWLVTYFVAVVMNQ